MGITAAATAGHSLKVPLTASYRAVRGHRGLCMRLPKFILLPIMLPLACTISNTDRCSEGRVWSEQFLGCMDPTSPSTGGSSSVVPDVSDAQTATDAEGPATVDDFGAECQSNTGCKGPSATFCLLDPTNPTSPGMCTIAPCTAAACAGTGTTCCDCTASPILGSIWTAPVCAPSTNVETLQGIGCSCQ